MRMAIIILTILNCVVFAQKPPNNGRFFYMDLAKNEDD